MNKIPIFIITCDRLQVLKQSIESYHKHISTPFEIIIHDNGSTFHQTVKYLDKLNKASIPVYKYQQINSKADLNLVDKTIQKYFEKSNNKSKYYVVTDCDIELCGKHDMLDVYAFLLDSLSHVNAVGPMLLIDDLPNHYPRKQEVIRVHESFWSGEKRKTSYNKKTIAYKLCFIDTTFSMYRSDFRFKRHQWSARTFYPYTARHLDWYINPKSMTKDQSFYSKHCSKDISHWSRL